MPRVQQHGREWEGGPTCEAESCPPSDGISAGRRTSQPPVVPSPLGQEVSQLCMCHVPSCVRVVWPAQVPAVCSAVCVLCAQPICVLCDQPGIHLAQGPSSCPLTQTPPLGAHASLHHLLETREPPGQDPALEGDAQSEGSLARGRGMTEEGRGRGPETSNF